MASIGVRKSFRALTITERDNFLRALLTIKNTIVANSPSGGDCIANGRITSQGHNLSEDDTCGFDSDPSNPDATDGDWLRPLATFLRRSRSVR